MQASQARDIARQWVDDAATGLTGFRGALWHGSIITLPDDATVQASSDIDIVLVVDDPEPQPKLGKIDQQGVLLDVSYVRWADVGSAEHLLADHSLAPTFRNPEIIADPMGDLARAQREVAVGFARREWVERRCESAKSRILLNLGSLDPARPFPDLVSAWLFGTGITTHVLLIAALRNPTVRKRYLAVREMLEEYDHQKWYPEQLSLLGCADMTQAQAQGHLAVLAEAFDAAIPVLRTPFFFASDITESGRRISIDGSRELIENGNHREAVFWLVATYARVQTVFHHDAPELEERHEPGFRALLADIGIASLADMERRGTEVQAFLPRLMEQAHTIMDETPEIECEG